MKIYLNIEPPYEWARITGTSVEEFGEVQSVSEYPISSDEEVIGVVPGRYVTLHTVDLPAKTRKQFNQALPFALEDSISENIENMHFVCPNWKPASEVSVFSIAEARMKHWLKIANDNKLPVSQLLPDYALLPLHEAAEAGIAVTENGMVARHGELGISFDADLLDLWLMDIPLSTTIAVNDEALTHKLIEEHNNRDFRHWPFGERMRHWLEYGADFSIDLWGDGFRPKAFNFGIKNFLGPIAVSVVAILVFIGSNFYRHYVLKTEIFELESRMADLLDQAVPGTQGVEGSDARAFLEDVLARGQGQSSDASVHSTLATASSVLLGMQATLLEMTYQNETLVLTCVLNDFSQVDALTKQFNGRRTLAASLQGSSAEDGKVLATYSITREG